MKNAYELAETILKSRPDKNGELKSSDSFTSIELYGISVCKKVQDMKFCECFHLENASGTGMITKVGRESQETFCNYRTMMSNFVEMLYRQLLVLCLCPCVLYDILFIPAKNIYSYSQLKEGTYAYGTASVKNI